MKKVRKLLVFTLLILLIQLFIAIDVNAGMSTKKVESSTPSPSETPTFSGEILRDTVKELMTPTKSCVLPCFWGIEPEKSTVSDIKDIISSIDKNNAIMSQLNAPPYQFENRLGYNFILRFKPDTSLIVGFSTQNDELVRTTLISNHPADLLTGSIFDISKVLETLGEPDEIFISVRGPSPSIFYLKLVYDKLGVLVEYFVDSKELFSQVDGDQPLQLCLSMDNIAVIETWLQSPNNPSSVREQLPYLGDDTKPRSDWDLKRITGGMDVSSFTRLLIDDPLTCIDLLSLNQLDKQGYNF